MLSLRNKIICCDCVQGMTQLPDASIPLTVTSPPYDGMRIYGGNEFDFPPIAKELWRITAEGGVVVWVVQEQIKDGSETGTSSEQRLYFRDIGFRLHHTMIMEKTSIGIGTNRYGASLEYAFVLSKGKPRTLRFLQQRSKQAGKQKSFFHRHSNGDLKYHDTTIVGEFRKLGPIWRYGTGRHIASENWVRQTKHAALMHERMARDFIISFSRPGDLIFDAMCGLGTTCKMALLENRHYLGFEIVPDYAELANRRLSDARQEYLDRIRKRLLRVVA